MNLGRNPFGIQKQSLSLSPVVLITFIEWILIPEPILPAQPVVHYPPLQYENSNRLHPVRAPFRLVKLNLRPLSLKRKFFHSLVVISKSHPQAADSLSIRIHPSSLNVLFIESTLFHKNRPLLSSSGPAIVLFSITLDPSPILRRSLPLLFQSSGAVINGRLSIPIRGAVINGRLSISIQRCCHQLPLIYSSLLRAYPAVYILPRLGSNSVPRLRPDSCSSSVPASCSEPLITSLPSLGRWLPDLSNAPSNKLPASCSEPLITSLLPSAVGSQTSAMRRPTSSRPLAVSR